MENIEQDARQFRIGFQLDEIGEVPPWGEPGKRRLHWYGLTSGRFWIETASGNPLEYSSAIQRSRSLSSNTPGYSVARLFEDLLSMLPIVLEPVPADIANIVANPLCRIKAEHWRDSAENESRWDRWYSATQWWHDRTLDIGYLTHAPELAFWRVGDEVFLQWKADKEANGIPVWHQSEGKVCIGAAFFEDAVLQFGKSLIRSIEERVLFIQHNGWGRKDCMLDIAAIVKEQQVREEFLNDAPHKRQQTDWKQVRASLDVLLALMGEQITGGL
jgi:hypothetical protein